MTPPSPFRIRMSARQAGEEHRSSTPLELFFDLTFVVAIGSIATTLAHSIEDGHAAEAVGPYLLVFSAIWWAWMNFTWFASGYDTDDVPYRVLTMVQMAGVLVLAAGVPSAFANADFLAITIGYLIMRIGLVGQWLRASRENPDDQGTALRYAIGFSVVMVGWLLRLLVDASLTTPSFIVMALLELCVPLWAGRKGRANWHPHHIAERYGLFTIIVLGESVLAAITGVQEALDTRGVSGGLITVALASLAIVFSLWWLYFLEPSGDGLRRRPQLSYLWGYGHYGIFAALGGLGAGLEVAVIATAHHVEASTTTVGFAVAIPIAVFLVLLWAVHAPLVAQPVIRPQAILPSAGAILLAPFATSLLGLNGAVVLIALVSLTLVTVTVVDGKSKRNWSSG